MVFLQTCGPECVACRDALYAEVGSVDEESIVDDGRGGCGDLWNVGDLPGFSPCTQRVHVICLPHVRRFHHGTIGAVIDLAAQRVGEQCREINAFYVKIG